MKIFLGGTCNNSIWRLKLIPKLELNNIDYFNPVVLNWTPLCQKELIKQRKLCDYVLYVITPKMTGVYSIALVVDDSNTQPLKTLFMIIKKDGKDLFTEGQIKSLMSVKLMIIRNGATYCRNFKEVIDKFNHNTIGKLKIKKSCTADSRTCDTSNVTKNQLYNSSISHILDVKKGINWFIGKLNEVKQNHDWTKLDFIDLFYRDFKNNFETTNWWILHKKEERHHISQEDGIRNDVDLFDVIEFLVDGVMAGMARSEKYRYLKLSDGLLETAFDNTVKKLLKLIEVVDEN